MADRRPTARLKRLIAERAAGCCEYCRSQERYATPAFSVEHIVPRQRGGRTAIGNLALACQGCNNHKYARTEAPDPVGGVTVPLFHPRRQRWRDHFAWDSTYAIVIGLTPTGRATVEALQLHRAGLVNLRRVLYAAGEHPTLEPTE
jgi:hypothetical protein